MFSAKPENVKGKRMSHPPVDDGCGIRMSSYRHFLVETTLEVHKLGVGSLAG